MVHQISGINKYLSSFFSKMKNIKKTRERENGRGGDMYEIDNFLDIKRENRGVHRKNKNMYKYIKRKQCPDVC